jgi:hypothetical protein
MRRIRERHHTVVSEVGTKDAGVAGDNITIPAASTTLTPSSLVEMDPLTGNIGTPIAIGNNPNVLAESADGKYLYIGLSASNALGQFNLASQSLSATYTLTVPGGQALPASGLAVQPGTDFTLAINTNYNGTGIFDNHWT